MSIYTHDPATYGTRVTKPPDFEEFWQGVLAEAAQIPLNPTLTPVPMRSTDDVEVFEVHYDSLNHVRIAGWFKIRFTLLIYRQKSI